MNSNLILNSRGLVIFLVLMVSALNGQNTDQRNTETKSRNKFGIYPHSVGSTLFLLGNIGDSVRFVQFNYGYRLTDRSGIIAEAVTWTYFEPLGTYMNSKEFYPGKVRAYGIGLGYKRFLWKNLFSTVEPTFFLQKFYDTDGFEIQDGFQLYLQFIVGYRFEFFKKRIFLEPAYALKDWPVNTNFPESFSAVEKGAPKYKFEPSLNFGFRF